MSESGSGENPFLEDYRRRLLETPAVYRLAPLLPVMGEGLELAEDVAFDPQYPVRDKVVAVLGQGYAVVYDWGSGDRRSGRVAVKLKDPTGGEWWVSAEEHAATLREMKRGAAGASKVALAELEQGLPARPWLARLAKPDWVYRDGSVRIARIMRDVEMVAKFDRAGNRSMEVSTLHRLTPREQAADRLAKGAFIGQPEYADYRAKHPEFREQFVQADTERWEGREATEAEVAEFYRALSGAEVDRVATVAAFKEEAGQFGFLGEMRGMGRAFWIKS